MATYHKFLQSSLLHSHDVQRSLLFSGSKLIECRCTCIRLTNCQTVELLHHVPWWPLHFLGARFVLLQNSSGLGLICVQHPVSAILPWSVGAMSSWGVLIVWYLDPTVFSYLLWTFPNHTQTASPGKVNMRRMSLCMWMSQHSRIKHPHLSGSNLPLVVHLHRPNCHMPKPVSSLPWLHSFWVLLSVHVIPLC